MKRDWRRELRKAISRNDHRNVVAGAVAGLGGAIAIGVMEWFSFAAHYPLAVIPFATSIVLVIGSPDVEPAQPRALIGGHLISALVGLAVLKLTGPQAWAAAAAVGLSILAMYVTGTFHPPAGINPLLVVSGNLPWTFLLAPVLAGALLLTAFCLCLAPRGAPPAMAAALAVRARGHTATDTDASSPLPQREAIAVAHHADIALVEGVERRAVADRDDGGVPATSPRAGGTARPPRARRARRSPRRGTDSPARAAARAPARGAAARRATACDSSARPRPAATRACGRPTVSSASLIWLGAEAAGLGRDRRSPPCSDPIGKYGRCGSIISVASAGMAIEPAPNGQMPAMARNSVDLPEPDGPVSSVRSPRAKAEAVGGDQRRAVRQLHQQARCRSIALAACGRDHVDRVGARSASVAALAIAVSNPSRRATTARHSAMVR